MKYLLWILLLSVILTFVFVMSAQSDAVEAYHDCLASNERIAELKPIRIEGTYIAVNNNVINAFQQCLLK